MWSAATPLKITYTTNDADIDISFARWIHGDGAFNAFDGRGRLLAHAYGPGDGDIAGDIHFDADEDWTVDYMSRRKHAKDFFATALHEAGHSLGLAHTTNKNAVMYPLYKGFQPELTLDKDDIYKLQTIYGSDPFFTYRPKQKKLEQSMANKPAMCTVNVKAIFYGPSGRTYILTSYQVYRVNYFRLDQGFPMRTRRLLTNAPINPQASVYLQEYKRLYIFKGTKLWRYTNMKLDQDYPIHIQMGHPEYPRAAVNIHDRRGRSRVFLFGNTYFWEWNYITEKSSGRPMLISKFWRGMPKSIDAAFKWKDGFIYVFTDQKYYKVSIRRRIVLPGYPKYFGPAWMGGGCGSQPK